MKVELHPEAETELYEAAAHEFNLERLASAVDVNDRASLTHGEALFGKILHEGYDIQFSKLLGHRPYST